MIYYVSKFQLLNYILQIINMFDNIQSDYNVFNIIEKGGIVVKKDLIEKIKNEYADRLFRAILLLYWRIMIKLHL